MRKLHKEELEGLQNEFIAYLISNGVDADMWQEIKKDEAEKAEDIIEKFSFHYFNTMLPTINYLTLKSENQLHAIHVRRVDFAELIYDAETSQLGYKEEKLPSNRNRFVFNQLENGYTPDNGEHYKELAMIYARSK